MSNKPELTQQRKQWLESLREGDFVNLYLGGLTHPDTKREVRRINVIDLETGLIHLGLTIINLSDGCSDDSYITEFINGENGI